MNIEAEIPVPFMFNALKHHRGFVQQIIRSARQDVQVRQLLVDELDKLGNLMMDFYLGALTPLDICRDIKKYLLAQGCFAANSYAKWLAVSKGKYRLVEISDGSRWTLLAGREAGRFVHVHPARYSPLTMRMRALPFKTAAMLLAISEMDCSSEHILESANETRKLYFDEPPIKYTGATKNILKILALLR